MTKAADQTSNLTQAQCSDTGPSSPCTDLIMPGTWQGSHHPLATVAACCRKKKNWKVQAQYAGTTESSDMRFTDVSAAWKLRKLRARLSGRYASTKLRTLLPLPNPSLLVSIKHTSGPTHISAECVMWLERKHAPKRSQLHVKVHSLMLCVWLPRVSPLPISTHSSPAFLLLHRWFLAVPTWPI